MTGGTKSLQRYDFIVLVQVAKQFAGPLGTVPRHNSQEGVRETIIRERSDAMRTLIAMVALQLHCLTSVAQQPTQPARYSIKEDHVVGLNKRDLAKGPLPFNKRYSELTPQQQTAIKAQYERMDAADEPPFPSNGLRPIYKALSDAQQRLGVSGDLVMYVDVDSEGQATSVSVWKSPHPEMTRFAAAVLMLEKYKPALCGGVACKMQFPISVQFVQ